MYTLLEYDNKRSPTVIRNEREREERKGFNISPPYTAEPLQFECSAVWNVSTFLRPQLAGTKQQGACIYAV
jgi:hypothetical protein